jgi:hypothetical protein
MNYTLANAAVEAHCDLIHGAPVALEHDKDGSHIFNFNVEEETELEEGKKKPTKIGYKYRTVRIFEEPTRKNIKKAVIRATLSESEEFALVNAYNSFNLGIITDESVVERYESYLHFLNDLDVMLNNLQIV